MTDAVIAATTNNANVNILAPPGANGNNGFDGWTPVLAVVTDTTRRVLQVIDWTGGTTTKPTVGLYVSASGLTATLASAIDIRGAAGAAGAGATFPATFAALKALTPTGSDPVFVKGAVTEGDGGQGWFWYDSSDSTSADNGGTVLVGSGNRWKRLFSGCYEAAWFGGLKADGTTDDSATIQAAIDYVTSIGGGEVRVTAPDHSSYIIRCNVIAKNGVTLSGDSAWAGIGISSPTAPKTQLYGKTSNPVIDTPSGAAAAIHVKGLSIVGFGGTSSGLDMGIRFRNVSWGSIRQTSVRNCGDNGIIAVAGVACVFEDIIATNCLLNTVRAAKTGVVDIGGTDPQLRGIEANTSQSVKSAGTNLYMCAILVRAANAFGVNLVGELSDVGIHVTTNQFHRFSNCRADTNFGHGWQLVSTLYSTFASCHGINNGQATTNTYDNWNIDVGCAGNTFDACQAVWDGTGNAPRYGFNDAANTNTNGSRNQYGAGCRSHGHATADFNTGSAGSGFTMPEGPCFVFADGDTSPSIRGWRNYASLNSGATTITTFDDSHFGQTFMVYFADANTTLQAGTIKTLSGVDELIPINTVLEFYNQAGNFYIKGVKSLRAAAGTATVAPILLKAGTNLTTPAAGAIEYDGVAFYFTPNASNRAVDLVQHFLDLSADQTGGNVNTAQTWFPGGGSTTITLPGSTAYEFEGELYLSRAAGTTSHTISVLFGGTATLTSINYDVQATSTTGNVLGAPGFIRGDAAAAVVVTAASIVATENNIIKVKGVVRINAGGTFIPQFQFSAAPGGAPTIKANSSFRMRPIGSNTVVKQGNWS